MSDAVTAIKSDHRLMEGLFDQLRSGQGDRKALLNEVGARLEAHSRAEEDHVYPAILRNEPDESREVYHGYEEHHEAAAMLYALKGMEASDAAFDSKLNEFIDAVLHHVQEEESEILPALAEAVSPEQLAKMGLEFDRRRRQELASHGIEEEAMSRDELYEKAKEAQIPGRSQMTKDELAEAVREAG